MARQPKTQQAILRLLSSKHLLTVPAIVDHLIKLDHSVNKTTVYRAVEKLLKSGDICKVLLRDDVPSYELRADHHDHFICETCGSVEAIACQHIDAPTTLEGRLISHHHLTFYGTCQKCQ